MSTMVLQTINRKRVEGQGATALRVGLQGAYVSLTATSFQASFH